MVHVQELLYGYKLYVYMYVYTCTFIHVYKCAR